jgi:hypothetical protein
VLGGKTMSFLKRVFRSKPTCPYCNFEFEKKLTRTKKCPYCENYIYVRKGELLTKEDLNIAIWLSQLEQYGITRKEYDRHNKDLSKQFGSHASVNDTVWRILNSLITKEKDHSILMIIYLKMADLAVEEGKNPKSYLTKATKQQLLKHKTNRYIKKVKVTTENDDLVCKECRALKNKVFTIDEALSKMPIPNVCQNIFCRCRYFIDLDSLAPL